MGITDVTPLCLTLIMGCGRIFGLDDAIPIPDAQNPCTADRLTCAGTTTTSTCNETCWIACSEPVTQATASTRCDGWNGRLDTLHTQGEQACVRPGLTTTGDVWIALVQSSTATTPAAGWSWNGDGLVPTFTNWAAGQPDDLDNVENGAEQCAAMLGGANTWSDQSCTLTASFACSRSIGD